MKNHLGIVPENFQIAGLFVIYYFGSSHQFQTVDRETQLGFLTMTN
jgi:hypothetical protein